jgi:hypothetical protein
MMAHAAMAVAVPSMLNWHAIMTTERSVSQARHAFPSASV